MSQTVPFVDLRAQHEEVRDEIERAIADIIDRSSFIGGQYVSRFESEFSDYLGTKEVIGVANGTDALWLSMVALGVGAGDAVITVPNTFIATVEAITRCDALPLFVDIDLATATMDPLALRSFLGEACERKDDGKLIHRESGRRVAAILPVHLYGLPADMQPILEIATLHGLPVIEDACQAHGAKYKLNDVWTRAGNFGVAAAFSFYPGKNLGAMGDGGAIATNDQELAAKLRWLRDHGQSEKYIHITPKGWNSRLDAIQAAVLSAKLKKLDEWNARRRQAAAYYQQVLKSLPLELPFEPDYAEHVYHLYVVRLADRENLRQELSSKGIGVGLHYPIPLHLQKAYQYLSLPAGKYPNTEKSAANLLSLPMHPYLDQDQIDLVFQAIVDAMKVRV